MSASLGSAKNAVVIQTAKKAKNVSEIAAKPRAPAMLTAHLVRDASRTVHVKKMMDNPSMKQTRAKPEALV